jgi:hypothetical protein
VEFTTAKTGNIIKLLGSGAENKRVTLDLLLLTRSFWLPCLKFTLINIVLLVSKTLEGVISNLPAQEDIKDNYATLSSNEYKVLV